MVVEHASGGLCWESSFYTVDLESCKQWRQFVILKWLCDVGRRGSRKRLIRQVCRHCIVLQRSLVVKMCSSHEGCHTFHDNGTCSV